MEIVLSSQLLRPISVATCIWMRCTWYTSSPASPGPTRPRNCPLVDSSITLDPSGYTESAFFFGRPAHFYAEWQDTCPQLWHSMLSLLFDWSPDWRKRPCSPATAA